TLFTPDSVRRFIPERPGRAKLQAGGLLFTDGEGVLAAYDLEKSLNTQGKVAAVWSAPLPANVTSMLAADQKLFVVTDDAKIHCFGAAPSPPVVHALPQAAAAPAQAN